MLCRKFLELMPSPAFSHGIWYFRSSACHFLVHPRALTRLHSSRELCISVRILGANELHIVSNGLSNSLTILLPLAFAILVGSGREAFSASSVAQYTVSFGSGEFSYAIKRPTKFLTAPRSSVKLSKNSLEEFVAAFYERSMVPDMPLYRVGGTLVRTTADALPSDG